MVGWLMADFDSDCTVRHLMCVVVFITQSVWIWCTFDYSCESRRWQQNDMESNQQLPGARVHGCVCVCVCSCVFVCSVEMGICSNRIEITPSTHARTQRSTVTNRARVFVRARDRQTHSARPTDTRTHNGSHSRHVTADSRLVVGLEIGLEQGARALACSRGNGLYERTCATGRYGGDMRWRTVCACSRARDRG